MKKLFMFLAVAGLATFGASCSSSDDSNNGGGGDKAQLVAKASPSSVEVNKDVTFSATAEGKAVDGVSFYLGETKLTNPYKFDAKGEYKVVAKKEGFKDSAAITVKVTEAEEPGTEKKTLTLTVAPNEVVLGQSVTFIVMEGTTNVSSTAKIFVNGAEVSGTSYTATAVGTYAVVAKKEGANDSAEKTFSVVEAPVTPENHITIGSTSFEINNSRLLANAVEDNGQYFIYTYLDEEDLEYCIFYVQTAEINQAGTEYNALSRVAIAVYQDPENPNALIFPGQGTDMAFVNAMATDFVTNVPFAFDDITALEFLTPGGNGVVNLAASNNDGGFAYNGAYTGVGVVEVDANGTPVQARGVSISKSVSKLKTQNIRK